MLFGCGRNIYKISNITVGETGIAISAKKIFNTDFNDVVTAISLDKQGGNLFIGTKNGGKDCIFYCENLQLADG